MDAALQADLRETVRRALAEDVGSGDVTARLIPADAAAQAGIVTRDEVTLAGAPWVDEVYRQLDERVELDWRVPEGGRAEAGTLLCRLSGPARALLTGERTALNLLQTLSATATVTARYSAAVAGSRCRVLDTRKTLPGLRLAQKYAVRCGGGTNHRIGLYDAILVKENHILAAGGIGAAVAAARRLEPDMPVEIEVESLAELSEALAAAADRILLDNFSLADLREAVRRNEAHEGARALLEASGGLTLESIADVAATGVDYISIGAITKNVCAIDLSMRFAID